MTLPSQIDKYRLVNKLGGGEFGEVYLAYDQALASNTAIKIIKVKDTSNIPLLIREAQIMDKCRHKHIAEIKEANVFLVGSDYYVVFGLEYLPEGSIEGEIQKRWISIKEACTRISHALSGLQYAHSQGFLHRDIKPGNILIKGDSTKLSDFGLAAMQSLCTGGMMSYRPHCPPEHYSGQPPTILFDIYAMGLTLFRITNNYGNWRTILTTLSNLEDVLKNGQLIIKIGYHNFIPQKIKRIINKACNPISTKRYINASEFKNEMDSLRFNIDWVKSSAGYWSGSSNSDKYLFSILSRRKDFVVEFKKNERRVQSYCNKFDTFEGANKYIEGVIADLTFQ